MLRIGLIAGAICMALTLPLVAQDEAKVPEVCEQAAVSEPQDESLRWRWRAYRHLDCVLAVVDGALERDGKGEDDTVTLSREELERIRTMAFWAKDATARINR